MGISEAVVVEAALPQERLGECLAGWWLDRLGLLQERPAYTDGARVEVLIGISLGCPKASLCLRLSAQRLELRREFGLAGLAVTGVRAKDDVAADGRCDHHERRNTDQGGFHRAGV